MVQCRSMAWRGLACTVGRTGVRQVCGGLKVGGTRGAPLGGGGIRLQEGQVGAQHRQNVVLGRLGGGISSGILAYGAVRASAQRRSDEELSKLDLRSRRTGGRRECPSRPTR